MLKNVGSMSLDIFIFMWDTLKIMENLTVQLVVHDQESDWFIYKYYF